MKGVSEPNWADLSWKSIMNHIELKKSKKYINGNERKTMTRQARKWERKKEGQRSGRRNRNRKKWKWAHLAPNPNPNPNSKSNSNEFLLPIFYPMSTCLNDRHVSLRLCLHLFLPFFSPLPLSWTWKTVGIWNFLHNKKQSTLNHIISASSIIFQAD